MCQRNQLIYLDFQIGTFGTEVTTRPDSTRPPDRHDGSFDPYTGRLTTDYGTLTDWPESTKVQLSGRFAPGVRVVWASTVTVEPASE